MPRFTDKQVIPQPQELVFGVARDVALYPKFLPWCNGARIFNEQPMQNGRGQFDADLIVGFRMFRERFTSRVTFSEHEEVRADYIKGPMKHCLNVWRFSPVGDAKTEVDFTVEFEFANSVLQTTVEDMFYAATQKMMQAFRDRAASLEAGKNIKSKPRVSASSPFLAMLDARRRD